jgi:hypothetical protein
MEVSGQHHTPTNLSRRKYPGTPLNGWLCEPLKAVWAVLEKIKCFSCAIIQSPDRPARKLITVTPSLCCNRNNKATKNLAQYFQERLADTLTFNFHDDGHFKLYFPQVLRPGFEHFCTAGRRWGNRSSGNRRMAILKRKCPVLPFPKWKFAKKKKSTS